MSDGCSNCIRDDYLLALADLILCLQAKGRKRHTIFGASFPLSEDEALLGQYHGRRR